MGDTFSGRKELASRFNIGEKKLRTVLRELGIPPGRRLLTPYQVRRVCTYCELGVVMPKEGDPGSVPSSKE